MYSLHTGMYTLYSLHCSPLGPHVRGVLNSVAHRAAVGGGGGSTTGYWLRSTHCSGEKSSFLASCGRDRLQGVRVGYYSLSGANYVAHSNHGYSTGSA